MKVVLRSATTIICISSFLIIFHNTAFAQAPEIQWTKTYGGSGGRESGNSVQQTSDGGYIIAGTYNEPISVYTLPSDVWLIKTDTKGDTLWSKIIRGSKELGYESSADRGHSVQQTSDGGYIITSDKDSAVWLIRTDANGDTLWTRTFGDSLDGNGGSSVLQTSDGGYIITGSHGDDVWLIKTDANGDTLWTKTFGDTGLFDCGYSVEQTTDSGYVITGGTKGRPYANAGGWSELMVWLIKTNVKGDTLWTKTFEGNRTATSDWGNSVHQTDDGGYIITGVKDHNPGPGLLTGSDIYLIKTNMHGDTLWTKSFGRSNEFDFGYSVQQNTDDGYIIAGEYGGDIWLIKTNANGDTLWTKIMEGFGRSVQQTSDGGYIIAGSRDGEVLLIKVAPDITAIEENPHISVNNYQLQQNYPNPFNPTTTIEFSLPNSEFVELKVYNILGKEVSTLVSMKLNQGNHTYTFDGKNLASGIYYYRIEAGNYVQNRKMIYLK
jgi:hypothetical protein